MQSKYKFTERLESIKRKRIICIMANIRDKREAANRRRQPRIIFGNIVWRDDYSQPIKIERTAPVPPSETKDKLIKRFYRMNRNTIPALVHLQRCNRLMLTPYYTFKYYAGFFVTVERSYDTDKHTVCLWHHSIHTGENYILASASIQVPFYIKNKVIPKVAYIINTSKFYTASGSMEIPL